MGIVDKTKKRFSAGWAFLTHGNNSAAAGVIVAILVPTVAGTAYLWEHWKPSEPEKIDVPFETAPPSEPMVIMTLDQFKARQRELRDEITAKLEKAHAEDRARLQAELDAVNARLREPEKALEEARARIASLEARLDREANRFGADRIAAAKAALQALDYSLAEELFEEIRTDAQIAVQAAARAEYGLGEIAEAGVDWAKAAHHYRRAVDLDADVDSLNKATVFTRRAGDYATALPLSKRHLALAENGTAEEHGRALSLHALLLQSMGHHGEAEPLFRQALEIAKETKGEKHPDYAIRLNNLAGLLRATGRYDKAEPLYRQAMKIDRQAWGETHPTYATDLNNLAALLHATGRHNEAEPLFRQAMEIDRQAWKEAHPAHARDLNNLAKLLRATGRDDEAEPLFRQAMEITRQAWGEAHPTYATILSNLAELLRATGRDDEAEPLFRQAVKITRQALGEAHPTYATNLNNLALLLRDTGRYDKAEPLFRQAVKITRQAWGEAHPTYATILRNLAVLFAQQGKWAEAEPLMAQALEIFKAALPADHPSIASAEQNLAFIRTRLAGE